MHLQQIKKSSKDNYYHLNHTSPIMCLNEPKQYNTQKGKIKKKHKLQLLQAMGLLIQKSVFHYLQTPHSKK